MPDLEIGPNDYRKQDPKSGRWLQNVDRRFCFWMGVAAVAFIAVILFLAWREGMNGLSVMLLCAMMGFGAGAAFTLSLRRPDW